MFAVPRTYLAIFGGVVVLAVLAYIMILRGNVASLEKDVDKLETWQDNVVTAVRDASGVEETTATTAEKQIRAMGTSITELSDAIDTQNAAVERLEREVADATARAEAEARKRRQAINDSNDAIAKLEQMATEIADNMEQRLRAAQDLAYERGQ